MASGFASTAWRFRVIATTTRHGTLGEIHSRRRLLTVEIVFLWKTESSLFACSSVALGHGYLPEKFNKSEYEVKEDWRQDSAESQGLKHEDMDSRNEALKGKTRKQRAPEKLDGIF